MTHKHTIKMLAGLAIIAQLLLPAMINAAPKDEVKKGLYYVIVKQAEIRGQVFLLVGEEEGTSRPAAGMRIDVKDTEHAGVILSAETDKDGIFVLPNLEKGDYVLAISKLNLRMRIVEEPENASGKSYASKIIIIFLPPEMSVQTE